MITLVFGLVRRLRRTSLTVATSIVVAASAPAVSVFQEAGGVVSMEAEHASSRVTAVSRSWSDAARADASGLTVIQATPDSGTVTDNTTGPVANYRVKFTTTGTYYLWVRVTGPNSSGDSLHAGLDGALLTTGSGFTSSGDTTFRWDNTVGTPRISFNIAAPGTRTINLWMREDGVIADKIVLTTSSAYTPTGTGPAESVIGDAPDIISAASASGGVGTLFEYQIAATHTPTGYAATGLPAGLTVDASTGLIEGRPTAAGTFNATMTASNASGSTSAPLTLTIAAAPTPYTTVTAFKAAMANPVPGTVIVLANGSYPDLGVAELDDSGTATSPIVIRAQTPGGVTFTGSAQFFVDNANYAVFDGFRFTNGTAAGDAVFKIKGSDVRVTQCSIIDFNVGDDPNITTQWVSFEGDRNRLDHCYFSGKRGRGRLVEIFRYNNSTDYHRIEHNHFRDFQTGNITTGSDPNGFETVRIGTAAQSASDSFTLVAENYFEDCDAETEIISSKSGRNTIRDNTLINCKGAITLRQGVGATVTGNVVLVTNSAQTDCAGIRICSRDHVVADNYIQGLRMGSSKHLGGIVLMSSETDPSAPGDPPTGEHWPVENVLIQNNSIINSKQSFIYGGGDYDYGPVSVTFQDNLARNNIAGDGQYPFIKLFFPIASASYSGERYYGSALGDLPSAPPGVNITTDPGVTATSVNGYTLYFSANAGTEAAHINPLQPGDVGPSYTP